MNKIITYFLNFLLVSFVTFDNYSQQTFTLDKVIRIAHGESISSKTNSNTFENKYWQYFSYKRSFLPSLKFTGTLPNLNVGISDVTLPDGTTNYIRTSQINYSAKLEINQPLKWTGGNIFVSADLARIDLTGNNSRISYKASPFYVGYRQPFFRFNSFKWLSKIEPLEYEEAKRKSIEGNEDISIEAVRLFFEVVNNVSKYDIAKINVSNSDTLFKISQGRYNLGKIAESELLQIELTLLNAQKTLAQSELDVVVSKQKLKTFLGLSPLDEVDLKVEANVPKFVVDIPLAIEMANKYRSEIINFEKSLLQGKREVERAKRENSFNADFFISYGVTQTAPTVEGSVINLQDQESLNVGISIPIYNWGLGKARVKQQVANNKLIVNRIEQSKENFEREIFIQATQFNLMYTQVEISKKSMIVSQKRYVVSKQRFLIGKSDILTFNNSLTERNTAVNSYNQTLQQYWEFYYRIRKLTHYDFENSKILEFKEEKY